MKTVKNFKPYFSKILSEEYGMTKEGIKGYWANKEKEENYDNKRSLITSVGSGGLIGTLGFGMWDMFNCNDCMIPIAIAGGITALTTVISLVKSNPYKLAKYEEIDEYYELEKKKFKKRNK